MKFKGIGFTGVLLIVVLALAGCGGTQGQGGSSSSDGSQSGDKVEPIKIGLIQPATGDAAPWGQYAQEAAQLVVDKVNDNGGLLGRPVEVIFADSKGNAETSVTAFKKFINQDKVDAIIGGSFSTPTLAVKEITREAKIVHIVPGAKHPDVTLKGHPLLFRVNTTQRQDGMAFVEDVVKNIKAQKVAIIADKLDYGQYLTGLFQEELPKYGVEIVATEQVEASESNFAVQVANIKSLEPDAVAIILSSPPATAAFLREMDNYQLEAAKLVMGGGVDENLIEMSGKSIEDIWFEDIYVPSFKNDFNQEFVKAVQDNYGTLPNKLHLQNWDAFQVYVQAVEKAGTLDAEKVAEVIRNGEFDSPRGKAITFDENGQIEALPMSLTIREGKIVERF